MRLWHNDLINILPEMQLKGEWRELNSIAKNQNKHILINFVYNKSKDDLFSYSVKVAAEMLKRGYHINKKTFDKYFNDYLKGTHYIPDPFVEKMDDEYLTICYFNLLEKYRCGGISEEEWQKIDENTRQRVREWVVNNLI